MKLFRQASRIDDVALGMIAGFVADRFLGDPQRHHPVAWFGTYAQHLEQRFYALRRISGIAYTASCVAPWVTTAALAAQRRGSSRIALTALVTWACLGGRSLEHEAMAVHHHLINGDVPAARERIKSLVGRDTSEASANDLARAVVESLAENQSDAVAATVVWAALAGPAGAVLHRCSNTLDATVGYRNEKYREFGWASARFDDVLNVVPSRLSVLVTIGLTAATDGCSAAKHVVRVVRRDAPKHPSPNAGPVEAAAAAALGVHLGGRNSYGGTVEDRGQLGNGRPVTVADIPRAVGLTRNVARGVLAVSVLGRLAFQALASRPSQARTSAC